VPAEPPADAFAAAHASLLADPALQFAFPQAPPERPPPSWLVELLSTIAPVLGVLFWATVALVLLTVAVLIGRELLRLRPAPKKPQPSPAPMPDLRPTPGRALALLQDADALAAQGRFAEAAHLLLLRSVADIEERRPNTIRASLTSREIAALPALPPPARNAFSFIAAAVERSLFGGRPVDAGAYADCRKAYEGFAMPQGWA
jgi:hypothetical protein